MNTSIEKIILIDQVKFFLVMMELALKEEGIRVFTIDNPKGSQYLIEDLLPDLMAIDLETIRPYWEKFYSDIKAHKKLSQVPLIALGAPHEYESFIYKDAFKHFIPKPVSPVDFKKQILGKKSPEKKVLNNDDINIFHRQNRL